MIIIITIAVIVAIFIITTTTIAADTSSPYQFYLGSFKYFTVPLQEQDQYQSFY